jgi:hypothetical protein
LRAGGSSVFVAARVGSRRPLTKEGKWLSLSLSRSWSAEGHEVIEHRTVEQVTT